MADILNPPDLPPDLPGVPLAATVVRATEDGFDVLASDGASPLVHVVVAHEHSQPLRLGDPVFATVDGVGLEGDLLREGRPGGDQQPVQELTEPASDVTFSWRVGEMWMKAVRLAPLRLAAREMDWLGIRSLGPVAGSQRPLSAGDPAAALWGLKGTQRPGASTESTLATIPLIDTGVHCADPALQIVGRRVSPSEKSSEAQAGGAFGSLEDGEGQRHLSQMHLEEATTHFHRADHLELRAWVEQDLRLTIFALER